MKIKFFLISSFIFICNFNLIFSQQMVLEKMIQLPDEYGGLLQPTQMCFDSLSNSYFVTGHYGNCVTVVDAITGIKKTKVVFPFTSGTANIIEVSSAQKLYCFESYGDSIAVLSMATREIIKYLPIPVSNAGWPYIITNTDSAVYFTCEAYNGLLYKIDSDNDSLYSTITLSGKPRNFCFNSANDELYAGLYAANKIAIINTTDNSLVKELTLNGKPSKLLYDESYNRVFISTASAPYSIYTIDCSADTVLKNEPCSFSAGDLAFAYQQNKLYCSEQLGFNIKVINFADSTLSKTITMQKVCTNVFYNPVNQMIYAYSTSSNYDPMLLIDCASDSVVNSVYTGRQVYGIVLDNRNSRICMMNSGDNSLSILNASDNSLIATCELGIYIHKITCNPDHNKIYANFWDIYCVDGIVGNFYKTIHTGLGGIFRYNPFNGRNYNLNNYSYLDGISDSLLGEINVGYSATNIIFTNQNTAYSIHYSQSCINLLDLAQQQVIKNIPLTQKPDGGAVLHPNKPVMYLSNYSQNSMTVVNVNTNQILKIIPTGTKPVEMCYDVSTDQIFFTIQNAIKIIKCDGDSLSSTVFPIIGFAEQFVQHPTSRLIFATLGDEGKVIVINPLKDSVITKIPVQSFPDHLLYYPPNDQIIVANHAGNSISVIDCNALMNIQNLYVGQSPDQIVYLPSNNRLFITCVHSSAISVVNDQRFVFIEEKNGNRILEDFILYQNYPNPFNPSTKISWQSPIGSWQTIKVYDVLGKEVATLVDEYKPAGSYEVEFQSLIGNRQLASGIYFYQLKVGEFIQTKKMLLIK